jgi:hypothetical protein
MTETIPFSKLADPAVVIKVNKGTRPERPTHTDLGLTDSVWSLTEACWNQQRNERPPISTVLSLLKEASRYWNPPSPTTASSKIEPRDDDLGASISIPGAPGFFINLDFY